MTALKQETLSLLTRRQRDVANAILGGCNTHDDIAKKLCLSKRTVQTHLYYLYSACAVSGKMEFLRRAQRGEI